ncbi:SDR family NAD(P)-dependent oxidoreductase [Actinomycetospora sp. CA-084318]|uniref:SDR family NAD(P)-dependent oxidoreductase n=1 Tax=Actinomycetospora sp. CA-084318 TaxID=3239892 RepID=UPI003D978F14
MYAVPDQTGRTAVVTGANSGTGKEAAARLAAAGARVVLAVRTPAKGEAARADVLRRAPGADVAVRRLDLADQASVREFAEGLDGPVDLLLNNAGVMAVPEQHLTVDGFELQTASNVLGPVALTVRLLPQLLAAPAARVVWMSSTAAWTGRVDPERPEVPRRYSPTLVYGATKLADLLVANHLARVADARGWTLRSLAAHPGITRTELFANSTVPGGGAPREMPRLQRLLPLQEVDTGAEPMLVAATDPAAGNGTYWGPTGWGLPGLLQMRGRTAQVRAPRAAADADLAARYWTAVERVTGVSLDATVRA